MCWALDYIYKTKKTHGPCPHGAHSLAEADKQSQIQQQSTRQALRKKGLVLPGACRAGFPEMETMELGLGWGGVRQMEGKGGSTLQAEATAYEQAESWKRMPLCRMMSGPVQLEQKSAHKLKRWISFSLLMNRKCQEIHLHITINVAKLWFW